MELIFFFLMNNQAFSLSTTSEVWEFEPLVWGKKYMLITASYADIGWITKLSLRMKERIQVHTKKEAHKKEEKLQKG